MAISPWHLLSVIRCDDAASLLSDFDPAVHVVDSYRGHLYDEWRRVMVLEAQAGLLRPSKVLVSDDKVPEYTDSIVPKLIVQSWREISLDEDDWLQRSFVEIRLSFERTELYRWLKTKFDDADIPEALRVMPKPKSSAAPQDKPLHHRRRHTYLTLIEALALEALEGEMPAEPYKTAGILRAILERHGLKLDKDPIADTVKEIQAAREERASERP